MEACDRAMWGDLTRAVIAAVWHPIPLRAMSCLAARWRSLAPRTQWSLLAVCLLLLVGLSSGIGIHNGFTYDDVEVIQHNAEVPSIAIGRSSPIPTRRECTAATAIVP